MAFRNKFRGKVGPRKEIWFKELEERILTIHPRVILLGKKDGVISNKANLDAAYWVHILKGKYKCWRRWKVAKDKYEENQEAIKIFSWSWSRKWAVVYIAYSMNEWMNKRVNRWMIWYSKHILLFFALSMGLEKKLDLLFGIDGVLLMDS